MDIHQSICTACLSGGRTLIPISKLTPILQEIDLNELYKTNGVVCWECSAVIKKFYKFKNHCKQADLVLSNAGKNLKPLSSLTQTTKLLYDYEYYYNFDPLTESDIEDKECNEIKIEPLEECISDTDLKEETDIYVDNIVTEENQSKNIEEVYDTNTTRKKEKKKIYINVKDKKERNHKLDKQSQEEVREKFEEVVFTEEEMIRNREEKRNQPNFKKIPFKCDSCVLGFTRKETYEMHLEKKHDEKRGAHLCPVCLIRFPSLPSAERHKRKHYVCYRCKLCKYETVEMWSAANHCRVKHRNDSMERIHCAQCRVVCRTPEDLAEHIRTEHTLYCNECGEKFKGKNTLRTHKIRIHAVKREFTCDLCSKTFMTKSRLESHMVSHNASIAKKLAYCAVCNVQYKNIYVYRNHLKNSANHAERAYPCPECNKKFASKVYWTKHYNFYHLHKSQYKCEACNKLFISDWRLKNHKQKHHGLSRSRDHSCTVCGKKFFTLSTLRAHQLTHSAQRTYMCEDCGDTFRQRPALYTHARLAHKSNR